MNNDLARITDSKIIETSSLKYLSLKEIFNRLNDTHVYSMDLSSLIILSPRQTSSSRSSPRFVTPKRKDEIDVPMTLGELKTQPSSKEPTSQLKYRDESFSQFIDDYINVKSKEENPLLPFPSTINLQIDWERKTGEDSVLVKNQRIEYDAQGNVLLANLLHNIQDLGMDLNSDQLISFFSEVLKTYKMIGRFPILPHQVISRNEIDMSQGLIKLKLS